MAYQSSTKPSAVNKLAVMLLASLPMVTVLGSASLLTGCGFHLRGYDAPLRFEVAKTAIIVEDKRI